MILTWLDRYRDVGLLIIRVGLGIMMMTHGFPKVTGGPEMWNEVGGAMGNFGINFAPTFWGFMAAVAEFGGGLLLALGLVTRVALFLLMMTMITAATLHLRQGDGIQVASHAIELFIVFLGLFFTGPGRFSLDERLTRRPTGDYQPRAYTPTP